MTRNYLKTGWRQLKTQRTTTLINISGLALAISFAITVFVFQDYFLHMDRFHSNGERIFQVLNHVEGDDESVIWSDIPLPVINTMTEKVPAVEYATVIKYGQANVRYKEEVFREFIWYVDADYLRMFDFPIKYGSRDALNEKSSIVISKGMASKYFGRDDVVGEVLNLKLDGDQLLSFTVSAVMDEFPKSASFGGELLLPIENYYESGDYSNWSILVDGLFVQLNEKATVGDMEILYDELITEQNQASERWKTTRLETAPLHDLSVRQIEIDGSIAGGAHPSGRRALTILAIMLLTLACFNYINIAVSSATRRLKEIALRKVMGGQRAELVKQFLVENLVVCILAIFGGLLISYFLLLPGFNASLPIHIPFGFSSIQTAIIFFICLILVVTLASGSYPAFYIFQIQADCHFQR